tara:strand:+ start:390 stop:566 length:177 start_codon:yes stop_codon:yes gene_type:complete
MIKCELTRVSSQNLETLLVDELGYLWEKSTAERKNFIDLSPEIKLKILTTKDFFEYTL